MNDRTEREDSRGTAWRVLAGRLSGLTEIEDEEAAFMREADIDSRRFARGQEIFAEGDPQESIFLCMSGWGALYRLLPEGQRQVVDFVLPGSLFGLHAGEENRHVGSAEALIDLEAAVLPTAFLRAMARNQPRLACAFGLAMSEESSRLAERVVSLGRRDAEERLGHFFLELRHRLSPEGEADETDVRLPVPQQEVADFLGLTPVHVSRTMRRMQEAGIIDYDDERVEILDPESLAMDCDFDAERLTASPIPEAIRKALVGAD